MRVADNRCLAYVINWAVRLFLVRGFDRFERPNPRVMVIGLLWNGDHLGPVTASVRRDKDDCTTENETPAQEGHVFDPSQNARNHPSV